jgi:AAA+ superfamily predicted ATPase
VKRDVRFHHLQAELARIDVLIRRAVERFRRAGRAWDDLLGTVVTDEQVESLLEQPFAASRVPDSTKQNPDTTTQPAAARKGKRSAQSDGAPSHLDNLRESHRLDPFDFDAFLICLAPALDVRYERIYGYLQDDVTRKCAGVNLILDLLCPTGPTRLAYLPRFADDSPLMKSGLIERAPGAESATLLNRPLRAPDAVVLWLLDEGEGRPEANESLSAQMSASKLATLARRIEARFHWDDIVLPDDQKAMLRELVATVQHRRKVLGEWGIGRKLASSDGVTALFAGPPGTGKTMAAEVIAAELGLDLYKIDLSAIVSKYIGETEKNLERIFSEAERTDAILFFDEADALFGKRSEVKDAHDRYANIEISYLLQRMEAYNGVTILATNLRANLDDAFTRRLHFSVDFPFPDAGDRLRIWHTLFPPELPREPQLDFAEMARRYKLAGGGIRNIIVSAAYLAASNGEVVTMEHLAHGARREMQKMGRLTHVERVNE